MRVWLICVLVFLNFTLYVIGKDNKWMQAASNRVQGVIRHF